MSQLSQSKAAELAQVFATLHDPVIVGVRAAVRVRELRARWVRADRGAAPVAEVFVGLWLTHIDPNISAIMGMPTIIGIVTEVAIFYFSEYEGYAAQRRPEIVRFVR
jgi:hypothetical protein